MLSFQLYSKQRVSREENQSENSRTASHCRPRKAENVFFTNELELRFSFRYRNSFQSSLFCNQMTCVIHYSPPVCSSSGAAGSRYKHLMVDRQLHSSVEPRTGVSLEPLGSLLSACVTVRLWQFKGVKVHVPPSVGGSSWARTGTAALTQPRNYNHHQVSIVDSSKSLSDIL